MKAVVVTGEGKFDWADIAPPTPTATQALVRIRACGICNSTDQYLIDGREGFRPGFPFVLGHEAVGEVIDVGAEVTGYRVGDLVTRASALLPGSTRDRLNSGWGGFAELGVVEDGDQSYTAQRQVVLPAGMTPEDAFLCIALAETRAWLEQVTEQTRAIAGLPVVVLGTGIAGLSACYWAHRAGANPVIALGRRPERLLLARERGANATFLSDDPNLTEKIREHTNGRMASLLIEAVGKPEVLQPLVGLLGRRGVLGIYGAAPQAQYQAIFDALPEGCVGLRPGPEEHRYTRRVGEEILGGMVEPLLWRSHLWEADELHTAFAQVASGEVLKGCIRL